MTNLDEHLDEFLAEKAAKAAAAKQAQEAKEEAERAERRKRDALARLNRNRQHAAIYRKIADTITGDHNVIIVEDEGTMAIDGIPVHSQMSFNQDYSAGSGRFGWGSKPTGRMSIVVGDYGDRKRYPQRKDGSHSYGKIAEDLVYYATRKLVTNKLELQRRSNDHAAQALRQELGMPDYSSAVVASATPDKPIMVDLARLYTPRLAMTVNDARQLLKVLQQYGVKLS